MTAAELVTAEQYLHTSFEHDAEFVEGRIVERPLPTWNHSITQGFLLEVLSPMWYAEGFFAVPEQRVQVRPNRFRVPDVCVVLQRPTGPLVTEPPHLCVEILSPEDRFVEVLDKIQEYLRFGVPWVWVIDPVALAGEIYSVSGVAAVENYVFTTDLIKVDLSRLRDRLGLHATHPTRNR